MAKPSEYVYRIYDDIGNSVGIFSGSAKLCATRYIAKQNIKEAKRYYPDRSFHIKKYKLVEE